MSGAPSSGVYVRTFLVSFCTRVVAQSVTLNLAAVFFARYPPYGAPFAVITCGDALITHNTAHTLSMADGPFVEGRRPGLPLPDPRNERGRRSLKVDGIITVAQRALLRPALLRPMLPLVWFLLVLANFTDERFEPSGDA